MSQSLSITERPNKYSEGSHYYKFYDSALRPCLLFLLVPFQKTTFNKKKWLRLKIDSAVCTGNHGKLTCSLNFLWPPFEGGLSISKRIAVMELMYSLISIAILSRKNQDCTEINDWKMETLIPDYSRAYYVVCSVD
jgi:hypothetical protein